jgi:hypothetical protein
MMGATSEQTHAFMVYVLTPRFTVTLYFLRFTFRGATSEQTRVLPFASPFPF